MRGQPFESSKSLAEPFQCSLYVCKSFGFWARLGLSFSTHSPKEKMNKILHVFFITGGIKLKFSTLSRFLGHSLDVSDILCVFLPPSPSP